MKKWILGFALSLMVCLMILWNTRPRPQALTTLEPTVDPLNDERQPGLKVQFLGNTNILLDDGETRILTDGFFSRPSAFKVLFGKVQPNQKRIEESLKKAGIEDLDLVIPLHSHFDHVMDAPVVSKHTGAMLMGSKSTVNVGIGLGLKEGEMTEAPIGEIITIGEFQLQFIVSNHWQYPDVKQREKLLKQPIAGPLVPPASIYDYKEGISYTLLITHGETKLAIQGSAGYVENAIKDFDADILFLAIAGLEVMDEAYNAAYQKHIVEAVSPEVIVPIHWDDFTTPLGKKLKTTNWFFNKKFGTDLSKAFEIVIENNPHRQILVLPPWNKYSVDELLQE